MTTLSLQNEQTNFGYKVWHYAAVVPFYAIQKWFALFLITSGTLYASAQFNMLHEVFPPVVAHALAVGIEWTYLSGLAYATELKKGNRWSTLMIIVGALTSGLFGMLYIIGHYKIIPDHPTTGVAWTLAVCHVVPLILMIFLYTLCKRDYLSEQKDEKSGQRKREEEWRDAKLALEIEKDKILLERERIKLDAARQRVSGDTSNTPVTPVSQSVTPRTNNELRALVVDRYVSLGDSLNVTHESKQLGISRAKWYKLVNEAKAKGELS